MTFFWALYGVGALVLIALAFFAGRKARAAALRESEARFRAIADHSPDHLIVQDKALRYVFVMNPQLGLTQEDMLGKTDHDFLPRDDAEKLTAVKKRVLEEGKPVQLETSLHSPTGEQWFDGTYVPRLGEDGEIDGLIGYFRNVTGRKQAEIALRERTAQLEAANRELEREREAGLRHAQDLARVSHIVTGPDGSFTRWSEGVPRLLGLEPERLPKSTREWLALVHPDDRERFRAEAVRTAKLRARTVIEYRLLRGDGSVVHLRQTREPIGEPGADGRSAWFTTMQDVTEQKQAEQALRESERRYRTLVTAMAEGIVMQDSSGAITASNRSAERILGLSEEQMFGRASTDPRWRAIHEDGSPFPGETHPAMVALKTGMPQAGVTMGVRKPDGAFTWISINSEPLIRAGETQPYAVVTTFHDITQRKEVERALREEQRRLALLADNVPAMIAYVDAGRRFRYANLLYRVFYAGSAAPIEGRTVEEVVTPQTWQTVGPQVARALSGEPLSYAGERRLHDGSLRYVSVSLVPHYDEATGAVQGIYILALDITAQHQAEVALRESEAGLRHAQEMAGLAHVVMAPDGAYERWSENLPRLVGLEASRMPRSTRESLDLLHPEDRDRVRSAIIAAGRSHLRSALEYRVRRGGGALVHLRQTMEPLGEPDAGGRQKWFVTMQDVTEQKQAEERIRRLSRMHAMLSAINAAIVRIRDRQALFDEVCRVAVENGGFVMAWIGLVDREALVVKPRASSGDDVRGFLDAAPLEVVETKPGGHGLAGRAVRELKPMVSNEVQRDPQRLMKKECAERGINSLAVLPLVVGGEAIGVIALYAADAGFFDDEEMRLLLELAGDIAFALDHIQKEEQLRYLAYYDPLTGLANRTLLLERLAQYADIARAAQHRLALILIDIERFKAINDSFGRQVGDGLLKQVGARLAEIAGSATHVARVAADQFAIVAPRVRSERNLIERLEQGSRRLDGEPYRVGGTELRIATRAGVALFPDDGGDAETLFRNAESALKKAAAGEPFIFYTPQMNARLAEMLSLEHKLRLAVERGEFVLHYQPKVDCTSRSLRGVEALIRWQSPDLGLVPPMRFIPLLEETGLIHPVGSWALRQAALDHRRWVEQGLKPPRVAVNVSAIQLRRADFVTAVEQAIKDGVVPTAIDLEITESAIMEEAEASIAKLLAVRTLGVDIAIDDFGTGYSSLGYLTRLPVRSLKIDRSFVVGMVHHTDTMTLVSSIVSLAHSLRLKVVAEGVDAEEQVKYLQLLRCDEMQGYLFSKPVSADRIEALLRTAG